ncbi:hypothetical protein OG21DRAFT_896350 [Imleria badia]|nr:hypothetical protein OG21DRAFT_896350 [Imleria badia]
MTLQQALLLLVCACLFATLIAATEPAHVHEARQGPVSIEPLSTGPGPESIPSTSTSHGSTTMSSTPSTSLSSSGTSSARPQPSSSPGSLDFTIQNMTTCTSGLISWKYSGKDAELLLSITNIGMPQNDALLRIKGKRSLVSVTMQQLVDTNTTVLSWTWSSVTLTQGWYEIQGLALSTPTVSNNSAPFFISNGTDVTCLAATSPHASSSASSSVSTLPSSNSNVGIIVGGVVGGVVAVALAIIAGVCLWSRRRKSALNTPVHYERRASTYSIQTPTIVASESFRPRVPSTQTSTQTLEQQAQRIRSSMETSVRRRSERLSMPTLPSTALSRLPHSPTHNQPQEEYPLTPVTPTPVNRSVSTGAVSMTARRTSRKPVPHYDSSLLLEDKNADSVSTLTAGAESSQSHGTGLGTGAHGMPSDLVHKPSFGDGRPVHYLIPDMPPPQQD